MKRTGTIVVVGASLILVGAILAAWLPFGQNEESSILPDQAALLEPLVPTALLPTAPPPATLLPEGVGASVEVAITADATTAEAAIPFAYEVLPAPAIAQPSELPVELSELFAEAAEEVPVFEPILIQPTVVLQPLVPLQEEVAEMDELPVFISVDPVQAAPAAPASTAPLYVYFFTGIPVQSSPVQSTLPQPAPMQPTPMPTAFYAGGWAHTGGLMPVTFVPAPVIQTHVIPVFTPRVVPSRVGAPKLVYPNGVVIRPTVYFPNQPIRNVFRAVTP